MAMSQDLYNHLSRLHLEVNSQIEIINDEANLMGIAAVAMRLPDGGWVMPGLLLTKSNILLALSNLEASKK